MPSDPTATDADPAADSVPGGGASIRNGHTLKRNIVYAVAGDGLLNACRFGVIVLLAKFATAEILGQYTFAMAVAAPVVLFCILQLRGALVADAAREFTFGSYRALQHTGLIAAAVVLLAFVLWRIPAEPSAAFVLILAGVFAGRLALSLPEVYWGIFQKRERLDFVAWSKALRGLAVVVPFAVVLPLWRYLTAEGDDSAAELANKTALANGTALATALYAVGWVLVFVLFDRPRVVGGTDIDATWDWSAVRRLAVQTFPLGLVTLGITLCESMPRWVIEAQVGGKEALGYFGALAYVTMVGSMLTVQAGTAAANRLATYYRSDLGAFVRLVIKLTGLAAAMGVGALAVAWLCGEWLLRIVFLAEYAAYYREFLLIIAAQCLTLLAIVFGITTTQMRLFWIQVPVQLLILASTTLAAFIFIPAAADIQSLVAGGAKTVAVRAVAQFILYAGCLVYGILRARSLRRT